MDKIYEEYCDNYIYCYKKVNKITKMIKNLLYPGEFEFADFDDSQSVEEKLQIIKNDLESKEYADEVSYDFINLLEIYYPNADIDDNSLYVIKERFKNDLDVLEEMLKQKYIPFIKTYTLESHPDRDNAKYTKKQIWEMSLKNPKYLSKLDSIFEDVIWAGLDSQSYDIVDGYIKQNFSVNDFEFNRYIGGNRAQSSIVRKKKGTNKINVDFTKFDKCFEDIYGQNEALETIKKVLKRNILFYNAENLNEEEKNTNRGPLATFMFYGPTGTGKTEAAKLMTNFIYNDENKLLILDMNTYKDSNVASNAIKGFPESYKDSEKGTDFTRFLTKNKDGVIVLDEFEKAPKEVREIFMSMLDEGKFRDALGNTYDLSGYIFVATTNASEKLEHKKNNRIGFATYSEEEEKKEVETNIKEELRNLFTAPIMNRFNNLVHFSKIQYKDALAITNNLINKMINKFESKKFGKVTPKIDINNIDEISKIILKECNYEKDGVRSLKNVVNDLIGSEIMEQILNGKDKILVDCKNNNIVVSNINTKRI